MTEWRSFPSPGLSTLIIVFWFTDLLAHPRLWTGLWVLKVWVCRVVAAYWQTNNNNNLKKKSQWTGSKLTKYRTKKKKKKKNLNLPFCDFFLPPLLFFSLPTAFSSPDSPSLSESLWRSSLWRLPLFFTSTSDPESSESSCSWRRDANHLRRRKR